MKFFVILLKFVLFLIYLFPVSHLFAVILQNGGQQLVGEY